MLMLLLFASLEHLLPLVPVSLAAASSALHPSAAYELASSSSFRVVLHDRGRLCRFGEATYMDLESPKDLENWAMLRT